MAWGLSQRVMMAGLGLKVVGSIKRDPDLMVVAAQIRVVGMPVKSRDIHSAIILNQLLFNKVAAIELGVAKFIKTHSHLLQQMVILPWTLGLTTGFRTLMYMDTP